MLLIKSFLADSPIHGIGVFAAEPVQKGYILWREHETVDVQFSRQSYEDFPDEIRRWMKPYVFVIRGGGVFFCGDNARFMNHALKANVVDVERHCIASRDIAAGEELTYDFGSASLLFDQINPASA